MPGAGNREGCEGKHLDVETQHVDKNGGDLAARYMPGLFKSNRRRMLLASARASSGPAY